MQVASDDAHFGEVPLAVLCSRLQGLAEQLWLVAVMSIIVVVCTFRPRFWHLHGGTSMVALTGVPPVLAVSCLPRVSPVSHTARREGAPRLLPSHGPGTGIPRTDPGAGPNVQAGVCPLHRSNGPPYVPNAPLGSAVPPVGRGRDKAGDERGVLARPG